MEGDRPQMTPAPEAYLPRPRAATIGNILGDSIAIYGRHLLPILIVSAAVFLPFGYLQNVGITRLSQAPDFVDRVLAGETGQPVYVPIISLCLQFLLQGFVIYIVVQHLNGRRPSIGAALSTGVTRMIPALGVLLCIALCFVPLVLPVVFAPALGLVMLIPIIIVGCGLFVAIAASVIERPGVLGALGRSWELTRGRRGMIFLMLFVVFLIVGLISRVLQKSVVADVTFETLVPALKNLVWVNTGIQLVFYSFLAVCAAVTYHHLRTSKEGVSANDLAAIFE